MRTSALVLCFVVLQVSVGCGSGATKTVASGTPPIPPPPPQSAAPNESWHFTAESANSQPPLVEAALLFQGSTVHGIAHISLYTSQGNCIYYDNPIQTSGSVDSANRIHLLTSPIPGANIVLTIDGSLSPDGLSITDGTYKIDGGCADGYTGTISAVREQALNGHYSGTLTLGDVTIPLSGDLSEANIADRTTGYFPVSGTVTTAGSTRAETYVLSGAQAIGNYVGFSSSSGTGLDGLTGSVDPAGQQITLDDYVYSDDCTAGYKGVLQRQ